MSYSNKVTIFRGVRITEDIGIFNSRLTSFIRSNLNSQLVGSCAEYHELERNEVEYDDLWDFLVDSGHIVWNEYLDSYFIGETCYSTDDENEWRDLGEWADLTCDLGEVQEFIDKYYNRFPVKTYLIMWTD